MESFLRMLNAQMILLVYLAVGMYCMKVGLIDRDSKEKLVDIILRITLPCMIFNSFNKPLTPEVMKQTALILVVAVSISILSFLLGKVIYNKYPQKKKSILQYCTLVNNSGFLGMPMVSAVYGSEGLFAASIFIIPNRIFMWTAGLAMFTTADFRTKCKNILLNPCIALPLVALYILNLIDTQPLLAGVSLILTGMPAGSTSALLAAKYGADEDYASRCIVTTTIMSLATIPVLMLFLK